jgi:hypothetical protein
METHQENIGWLYFIVIVLQAHDWGCYSAEKCKNSLPK